MGSGDWQPQSTARLTLPSGIAAVWWLDLATVPAHRWAAWNTVLDAEEQARAARFVRDSDRQQYIAAHALLRGMLHRHGGLDARSWRFITGDHGKPSLHPDHGLDRLRFNISHAPHAVACGLVLVHPIGVDIEDRDRPGGHRQLADAYFAPAEVAQLHAEPDAGKNTMFFLFWTLKEAYIKATGAGLSTPLDQFAFHAPTVRIHFEPSLSDHDAAWQFHSLVPTTRHTMSIAIRHGGTGPLTILPRAASHQEIDRLTNAGDYDVNLKNRLQSGETGA